MDHNIKDSPLRLFICGAHSTGKTTLQRHLAETTGYHAEPEVARPVIEHLGLTRDQFDPIKHPKTFECVQHKILLRQSSVERHNDVIGSPYVCDRGLDPLVYASIYVGPESLNRLVSLPAVRQSIDRHRKSLVFIVSPHEQCVVDDGFRLKPNMSELTRFTDVIKTLFDDLGIQYYVIDDVDINLRIQFVMRHIDEFKTRLEYSSSEILAVTTRSQ